MEGDGTASEVATTTASPVDAKLKEAGATDEMIEKIKDLGVETPDDLAYLNQQRLEAAGIASIKAEKLLSALGLKQPAALGRQTPALNQMSFNDILPQVLDDTSWTEALKAGGILKVSGPKVISVIRAALARRAGLFEIPKKLVVLMESYSEQTQEQLPEEYYAIVDQITRHRYADFYKAIPGLNGNFVTEPKKKKLLERIDQDLWPAIARFQDALQSWHEIWMKDAPQQLMASQYSLALGQPGMMPPMQPPDTTLLRASADEVIDAINKVFAGTGVPVSTALALDAMNIKEVLMNPGLPAMVGAANRELMLRMLDAAVTPTYPRLETNITRFVLAIMQIKDQTAVEEVQYFSALWALGSQIQWDLLKDINYKPAGIGKKRPDDGNKLL